MKVNMTQERRIKAAELEIKLLEAKENVKLLEAKKLEQKRVWLQEDLAVLKTAADDKEPEPEAVMGDKETAADTEEIKEESPVEEEIEYRSAVLAGITKEESPAEEIKEESPAEVKDYSYLEDYVKEREIYYTEQLETINKAVEKVKNGVDLDIIESPVYKEGLKEKGMDADVAFILRVIDSCA